MNRSIVVTDAYILSAIQDHVKSFWPSSVLTEETWAEGPISENVPGFKVLKLVSKTAKRPVIYVSNGCFVTEPTEHIKHEFFLMAPKEELRHVETLTMLANFHADKHFRLDVGSIINIGSPSIEDSDCDHLLISCSLSVWTKVGVVESARNLCAVFMGASNYDEGSGICRIERISSS